MNDQNKTPVNTQEAQAQIGGMRAPNRYDIVQQIEGVRGNIERHTKKIKDLAVLNSALPLELTREQESAFCNIASQILNS